MPLFTPLGYRTLEKHEAKLINNTILSMLNNIDEMEKIKHNFYYSGVDFFDTLSLGQKIYCLDLTGRYLLTNEKGPKDSVAYLDATVGAIFNHLYFNYLLETEGAALEEKKGKYYWRNMIIEASQDDPECPFILKTSTDDRRWEGIIECLKYRILWDEDYNLKLEDLRPDQKKAVFQLLGIDESYFVTIPNDPRDNEIQQIKRNIFSRSILN